MCTPTGLPVTFALTNPKLDERDVAIAMFDHDPTLLVGRHGQTIIADKGYASAEFEHRLAEHAPNSSGPPVRTSTADAVPLSYASSARSSSRSTTP